jgi:hypothetical protein
VKPKSRLAIKVDRRLARKVYRERFRGTDAEFVPPFDDWLEGNAGYLAEIMVLHPGGRATLPRGIQVTGGRDSQGRRQVARAPVELWWRRSSEDRLPYITAFRIEAPPGAVFTPYDQPYGWDTISVGDWWAALVLRLDHSEALPEAVDERPSAGKAPPKKFYARLVAEYDELVRDAHPAPISVLADRFQVRPGTVKSWLHRGRLYLKGEQP